jgi:hypothetical protein
VDSRGLTSRLIVSLGKKHPTRNAKSSAANGTNATTGRRRSRRLLFGFASESTTVATAAPRGRHLLQKEVLDAASSNQLTSSGQGAFIDSATSGMFEGVNSWDRFAASIFWVFVVCGGVSFVHLGFVCAVRRCGWTVPSLLVFPRIELIVVNSAVPGVTRAAVILIATGEPSGVALGVLVLPLFPVAILLFVFFVVRRRVVKGTAIVRWVPNDEPATGIITKYLPKSKGEWGEDEDSDERFMDGYGLLFEVGPL